MTNPFFEYPILNSPYECPRRHWELDKSGQPTQQIIESRRKAEFITPIPKPKKRKKSKEVQQSLVFDEGKGLSTEKQQYDPTSIINEVRGHVDRWRTLTNSSEWQVTPETARLLQHWRHHEFSGIRPFFCQVEAAETAIWLTEVAPHSKVGKRLIDHLAAANRDANPELLRLALKLADVRQATEDTLFTIAEHLPAEAVEALLELATGDATVACIAAPPESMAGARGEPSATILYEPPVDPFEHPDAQRRFRLISNVEELSRALEYPWDKWTVFLHPDQRQLVERDYSSPARVAGSAGTGKTIVALHRAAFLARTHPESRVLLTTFSDTLANALLTRLNRLVSGEPRLAGRIDVHSIGAIAQRLYRMHFGRLSLAPPEVVKALLGEASRIVREHRFTDHFLLTEWQEVVDAWQLDSWEAYRDVARLGRKTRLPEAQRQMLWSIFEKVRAGLAEQNLVTQAGMFSRLAAHFAVAESVPFDFVVVDEAQDLSVTQMRFLAALGKARPDALFFAGDLGQRIFQQPFSWKSLGVDLRGRSRTLRVNYRTSHQIRLHADRLLGPWISDVDGNGEDRSDTVSVFNGPPPMIRSFPDEPEEIRGVAAWIAEQTASGVKPHEFGLFVRSRAQVERATGAAKAAGLPYRILDDGFDEESGFASICTMHLAKGLEFRAVAVMACDDEVIPLQERIETVGDDADLQEVYDTERHLLYVACTRARDALLVTSVEPGSEFLDDLRL